MRVGIFLVAIVLLTLASAPAHAAYLVTEVTGPDVVMPGRDFALGVTVRNTGDANASAGLSAALYQYEAGKVCGPQTDARFKGFINRANVVVTAPAKKSVTYPPAGGTPWTMVIPSSSITEGGRYEVCVFALKGTSPVEYHDYQTFNLTVRLGNLPPTLDFSWTPQIGNVTTEFVFRAQATDPEGDPLKVTWDFGYSGAKGRARAEGLTARERFFSFSDEPRTYIVTVTATDGFNATVLAKEITVFPENIAASPVTEPSPPGSDDAWSIPSLSSVIVAAAVIGVARLRGRGRPGPKEATRRP